MEVIELGKLLHSWTLSDIEGKEEDAVLLYRFDVVHLDRSEGAKICRFKSEEAARQFYNIKTQELHVRSQEVNNTSNQEAPNREGGQAWVQQ